MAFKFTEEQLNTLDKSFIVELFLQLQEQNDKLSGEIQDLNRKMELLIEQATLSNKNRFGRSSEKMDDASQICFMEIDGTIVFFNEAEAVSDLDAEEPETLESKPARKPKSVGKKDADLSGLPVNIITHYMTEEELVAEFGENGWKQLPDAISKRYRFIPAKIEIDEHHVGVYASKKDGRIIKADHPQALLHGSLVSPTLAAAIMNGKYVNAVPLYRLEQEFSRYGLSITRQNMANWMIRLGESYLAILYDYLHQKLYDYHVIQADETPVLVHRDGRPAGSKSYMWVYRSGHLYKDKQIVLYDYHKTRNSSHPREFLKNYSGICVTDGYQVYHKVEKEREDLRIAGCWVDALFVYLKKMEPTVPSSGQLRKAYTYILNQEKYLRVFLEDGEVPIDNNASERAIRGFCIGKKNWQMIDTINGAHSSAIIYSIAETAKANNLKPYDYFVYLLEEIPKHMEDTNRSFLDDLLPWSPNLPDGIRKN